MTWDWSAVSDFMPQFWDGLLVTLQALALGSLISFALGLVWALLMRAPSRFVRWPVGVVTEFVRNTPLLVQLFFLFYVLPEWGVTLSALATGVIGIGLHYSTYTMQVYRAGIEAVPTGQWEAATALNLPRVRTWQVVILPQAIRRVVAGSRQLRDLDAQGHADADGHHGPGDARRGAAVRPGALPVHRAPDRHRRGLHRHLLSGLPSSAIPGATSCPLTLPS